MASKPRSAAIDRNLRDAVLDPSDCHDEAQQPNMPELQLLEAVLMQAISDARLPIAPKHMAASVQNDALAWIESGTRRSAFAFVPLCEVLGLDPSAVRRAVLAKVVRIKPPAPKRTGLEKVLYHWAHTQPGCFYAREVRPAMGFSEQWVREMLSQAVRDGWLVRLTRGVYRVANPMQQQVA